MTRLPVFMVAVTTLLSGFVCLPAAAVQVGIITPAQHDVIHDNSGNVAVAVRVEPDIDPNGGTAIRILVDGKPAAPDSTGTRFALASIERGEHWLQALLVDQQGQTLSVSDTIYFTLFQASVNSPARKSSK